MFDRLKTGDTLKIGEKEFYVFLVFGERITLCRDGMKKHISRSDLEFLDAEVVRKAPPKYTPVKWLDRGGNTCFGLSYGEISSSGKLGVLYTSYDIWISDWEVLEIEK